MSSAQALPDLLREFQDFDGRRQNFVSGAIEMISTLTAERDEAIQALKQERLGKLRGDRYLSVGAAAGESDGYASPLHVMTPLLPERVAGLQLKDLGHFPFPPVGSSSTAMSPPQAPSQIAGQSGALTPLQAPTSGLAGHPTEPSPTSESSSESGETAGLRTYVLVLLDASADVFMFEDALGIKGVQGGALAVEKLSDAVKKYISKQNIVDGDYEVVIKACANVEGLTQSLLKKHAAPGIISELRAFFAAFSGRFALCDFNDVGPGKNRAFEKLKGLLDFHVSASSCAHIVVGCTSESPIWTHLMSSTQASGRITVLQPDQTPKDDLPAFLCSTHLPGIFVPNLTKALQQSNTGVASSAMTSPLISGATNTPGGYASTIASTPDTISPPTQGIRLPYTTLGRFGPPIFDTRGKRLDRPLRVSAIALTWVKKVNLCPFLFLRGECKEAIVGGGGRSAISSPQYGTANPFGSLDSYKGVDTSCHKQHSCRPLTQGEWDALWEYTRRQKCRTAERGEVCRNGVCVFGH